MTARIALRDVIEAICKDLTPSVRVVYGSMDEIAREREIKPGELLVGVYSNYTLTRAANQDAGAYQAGEFGIYFGLIDTLNEGQERRNIHEACEVAADAFISEYRRYGEHIGMALTGNITSTPVNRRGDETTSGVWVLMNPAIAGCDRWTVPSLKEQLGNLRREIPVLEWAGVEDNETAIFNRFHQ